MIDGTVKDEARARQMCELEEALRGRSREIRRQLQVMNRVTDRRHDELFQELIDVDQSLAMLRGRARGQPRSHLEAP